MRLESGRAGPRGVILERNRCAEYRDELGHLLRDHSAAVSLHDLADDVPKPRQLLLYDLRIHLFEVCRRLMDLGSVNGSVGQDSNAHYARCESMQTRQLRFTGFVRHSRNDFCLSGSETCRFHQLLDLSGNVAVFWKKRRQHMGVRQRTFGTIGEATDQCAQEAQPADLAFMCHGGTPGLVVRTAWQRQIGEKGPSKGFGGMLEKLEFDPTQIGTVKLTNSFIVAAQHARDDLNPVAVGPDTGRCAFAQYLADLGEAPAKLCFRVVRPVPEDLAQAFPLVRSPSDDKVGKEGARFSRLRQGNRRARPQDREVSKDAQVVHCPQSINPGGATLVRV